MKILYKLKWLYVLGLFIFFLVNCNPLGIFGIGSSNEISSLIPIDGLNTAHIPNDEYFYININNSYYVGEGFEPLQVLIYAMDFGPGTDCKIKKPDNPEEGNTEDLYCIMDIMEGDLWFHNIVLEYNVPPEMCDYLGVDVPWHFNQIVGYGPKTVYKCDNYQTGTDDEGEPETETRYCLGCKTETTVAGKTRTICGCDEKTEGTGDDAVKITTRCIGAGPQEDVQGFCGPLDQSENDLANCCLGEYDLTDNTGISTKSTKWGGNLKECIGGLGRISWEDKYFNKAGLPIRRIEHVKEDGINEDYEVPALIEIYDGHKNKKLKSSPTFITANYWTDVEDKDSATSLPRFYEAPTNPPLQLPASYLGQVSIVGHPYFTLTCLDHAYEKKHRIHFIIREWNTQEEFYRFVDSKGSRGDPDIAGLEGSFCAYYEVEEENILPRDTDCNDFYDLDDWNNVDPGSGRNYNPYPEIIYKD